MQRNYYWQVGLHQSLRPLQIGSGNIITGKLKITNYFSAHYPIFGRQRTGKTRSASNQRREIQNPICVLRIGIRKKNEDFSGILADLNLVVDAKNHVYNSITIYLHHLHCIFVTK